MSADDNTESVVEREDAPAFFDPPTEPPDVERSEALADAILRACNDFGATPAEVVAATSAIYANHSVATGVPEWRAAGAIEAMYAYRRKYPVTARVLIKGARTR